MPAYCEVALPVPLDRTFTYAVPEGQLPQRGARVIVPFRNEKLIGVVTGLNAKARRTSRSGTLKRFWTTSRCSASRCSSWASGWRSITWLRWARCCAGCCR